MKMARDFMRTTTTTTESSHDVTVTLFLTISSLTCLAPSTTALNERTPSLANIHIPSPPDWNLLIG